MLKINNLKVPTCYTLSSVKKQVASKLGVNDNDFTNFVLLRKSIDARKKNDIHFVMSVGVELYNEKKFDNGKDITTFEYFQKKLDCVLPIVNNGKGKKVVVVGLGPAGLFCALSLAKRGFEPIVIERGDCVARRTQKVSQFWQDGVLDTECNVQFGEGGAGTFSDGKLNTGIKSEFIQVMLQEFVKYGAPEEILYQAKPHIGTDKLVKVVEGIRNDIIELGGKVLFNTKLIDLKVKDNAVCGVIVQNKTEQYKIDATTVVLAIGHSARDTFEMLQNHNIYMQQKEFSMGVRVEHTQELIDVSQYGNNAKNLPASEYKLSTKLSDKKGCYTFCMCPGGQVVLASSESNTIVTNGMSNFARESGFSNSAILVNVGAIDFGSDDVLAGVRFQQKYEKLAYELCGNYNAPAQNVKDFLRGKIGALEDCSIRPKAMPEQLSKCLPNSVLEGIKIGLVDFGKKIKSFDKQGVLIGVESRSSSPIKILRDENYESSIKGIYPCGEGCGYAGGITSASVDGIKVALKIMEN